MLLVGSLYISVYLLSRLIAYPAEWWGRKQNFWFRSLHRLKCGSIAALHTPRPWKKDYYYYYWYSAPGPVWAETRVQSGDWCVRFAGCCSILQTGHITLSSTLDQQLENHSTKYHRQQPLYNTLELLMMGIVVPETCWASSKIYNKNLCCI